MTQAGLGRNRVFPVNHPEPGRYHLGGLADNPLGFLDAGIMTVVFKLRIMMGQQRHTGSQHIHQVRMAWDVGEQFQGRCGTGAGFKDSMAESVEWFTLR
jgi:hypothetical protein